MSFIGEPLREWDVEEKPIIPERESQEVDRENEIPETSPEKEKEEVEFI